MSDHIVVPPIADLPSADPFNEVTDQSVEQAAAERFLGDPGSSQSDPTQQPIEETSPSPEEFDPNEQFYFAPGQALTRQQIAAFATFNELLEGDPNLSRVILDHLRKNGEPVYGSPYGGLAAGQYPPVPQQPAYQPPPYAQPPIYPPQPVYPPQPQQQYPQQQYTPQQYQQPTDIDLSDPTAAYLYSQLQAQQAALQNHYTEIQRQQSILGARQQAETQQVIQTAVSDFQAKYELDEPTLQTIRAAAGRMEVIPAIMRTGIDPVTGQPISPDPLTAVTRAMELASMAIPEVRDQILSNQQYTQQETTRRQNLRAVGGSSRTAPRTAPVPSNPNDRRAAMKQVIEAAMNGTHQE